jgi:acetyltransferase-like isoleucine patch superfamily enzyme
MDHLPLSPRPQSAIDRLLDRMGVFAHLAAVLVIYVIAIAALGLALAPAAWLLGRALDAPVSSWPRWPLLGLAFAAAFFVFGFALMIVVPVFNFLLPTRVRPVRGTYYSIAAIPWFLHNALFYLVRFTFLPFVTFTPFGIWFLRAMGMKIGRRTLINSEYISDPRLLTLGNDVVVGGSAHVFAHSGNGGHLNIAPVVIGDRVTLGLGATVMGDVVVGAGATILPHSVLLPGSRVGVGEIWGGVPARPLSREEMDRIKEETREGGEVERPPSGGDARWVSGAWKR